MNSKFHSIESAIADLKNGKIIIVVDDESRENEGDFLMSADLVTPEALNFMATFGRGLICTPVSTKIAQRLDLKLQVPENKDSAAFTISIDAKDKISTGISVSDRAHTIKLMTENLSAASDFTRPGHVFPLIAKDGGVLERPGHTEAAVDLMKLAALSPVAVICEIMNPDGSMARLDDLWKIAQAFKLKMISIDDLIKHSSSL
ncbi:MAG: 3,4-dihydroxy-2-butanone-4-phosphate synthase [Bacteriovoracaceae bacterium]